MVESVGSKFNPLTPDRTGLGRFCGRKSSKHTDGLRIYPKKRLSCVSFRKKSDADWSRNNCLQGVDSQS